MQFAVIGLGRFGASVAENLEKLGHEVLGIDVDEKKVQVLAERITHVVQADASDEEVLKDLGIRNFDVVVVAIGHDMEASILVTVTLKELGVGRVVAKAATNTHGTVLAKVGADRVIFPERDMGARLAQSLVSTNILDMLELSPDVSIVELVANGAMLGKTLTDLDLRARFGVTVLAIKKADELRISPGGDDLIENGDVLVAIGLNKDLAKLRRLGDG